MKALDANSIWWWILVKAMRKSWMLIFWALERLVAVLVVLKLTSDAIAAEHGFAVLHALHGIVALTVLVGTGAKMWVLLDSASRDPITWADQLMCRLQGGLAALRRELRLKFPTTLSRTAQLFSAGAATS